MDNFSELKINKSTNVSINDLLGNEKNNSFNCNDLIITLCSPNEIKPKPTDMNKVRFGEYFSDHMAEVDWTESEGWGKPKICPLHNLNLHPASKVFHFAPEFFEGMKAFRGEDGSVRLFRPEKNIARMRRGAVRASLPDFDPKELLFLIISLIRIEIDWVPNQPSSALYIRPTFIGTDASFDLTSPKSAKLYIITCPVGAYFKSGFQPAIVMADSKYTRAFPGGVGNYKMGSNYAPTIYVSKIAENMGCHQVLWLSGDDEKITEVGVMNYGFVLEGILRESCLEIVKEWNEFNISIRYPTINEIKEAINEERVLQFFGTGTACGVMPISKIIYKNNKSEEFETLIIPNYDKLPEEINIMKKLYETIGAIQYGKSKYKEEWTLKID
uniref:branched-chain-amino-acid transaminase n=1 Tax=Meloidogyne incognita TaxID=6306 RepID=A0A914MZS0_MELIC